MLLFLNVLEFRQKLIGTIIRVLVQHHVHSPVSNNDKDPYEVKCHIRAQCARVRSVLWCGGGLG